METKILKNEKGVSLVLLALAVVVIFGFGALAIDIGHLYNVKNQLQVAADAAALAGAARLVGENDLTQTNARNEAQRIAALNVADVAYDAVPGFGQSPGAAEGQPIPVSLQLPQEAGDIEVGNWDGAIFTPSGVPVNAIKVVAKRTGNVGVGQPQVQNWFARIFNIPRHLGVDYGNNFNLANVSAVAIAAKEKLPFLPIAVNEYWDEKPYDETKGVYPTGKPYDQFYPQSFMRQLNADNATAGKAGTDQNIFAILGGHADKNNVSTDMSGYVDILFRNEHHVLNPATWHELNPAAANGSCGSCDTDLVLRDLTGVGSGDVNKTKFDIVFNYMFEGIPDNVIPPNAVREIIRITPGYTEDNYNATNQNDPSRCPWATVAYFSGSGNITGLPHGPAKIRFYEKWPKGSKFMVMVYDGTGAKEQPNQAGAVTVIGYGIIEMDGYSNDPFNGNINDLSTSGSTGYGHAIPHKLAGEEDPYIIQPPLNPASGRAPDCSFTDKLSEVRNNFATPRLVDPSLHYGLHQQ